MVKNKVSTCAVFYLEFTSDQQDQSWWQWMQISHSVNGVLQQQSCCMRIAADLWLSPCGISCCPISCWVTIMPLTGLSQDNSMGRKSRKPVERAVMFEEGPGEESVVAQLLSVGLNLAADTVVTTRWPFLFCNYFVMLFISEPPPHLSGTV